jgi:hypothetical protein
MTAPATAANKATAATEATAGSKSLQTAYRVTFQDYAAKLNALQRIIDRGATGAGEFQAAFDAVEAARAAHSRARDCLAREFMRQTRSAESVDEQQIRKTARLIWEFAGRPEGTAERDWRRAESLVRTAVAC